MAVIKVFIKPFNSDGTYQDEYIEVTDDVNIRDLGNLKQKLDNNDYEVGIFKFSNIRMTLNNNEGRYSEVGQSRSIFQFTRANSLVKITWSFSRPFICGFSECGDFMGDEEEVYIGILNDEATNTNIAKQSVDFVVLGRESVLDQIETPFSALSNGMLASEALFEVLNQQRVTNLLTLDVANINPSVDVAIDDISEFETFTGKESIDALLEISNSILYVEDGIIYIKDRTPSVDVKKTFYGQASDSGIEDVFNLSSVRTGRNKMFNFWVWSGTSLKSSDSTSISTHGLRKKEIGYDAITTPASRQAILDAGKNEFSEPKKEFTLTTKLISENLALKILDRVNIDYPTVVHPAEDSVIPVYGLAKYGQVRYPIGQWAITIRTSEHYKILGKDINLRNNTIDFQLKGV